VGLPPTRSRLAAAYVVYGALVVAVIAAIVFDTSLFTDFGPFTGVWLALVIAGNAFLFGGCLFAWWSYLRQRRRDRLPQQSP
jgi:hypothetical protein